VTDEIQMTTDVCPPTRMIVLSCGGQRGKVHRKSLCLAVTCTRG